MILVFAIAKRIREFSRPYSHITELLAKDLSTNCMKDTHLLPLKTELKLKFVKKYSELPNM